MKNNITNLNVKMPVYVASYCRELLEKASISQSDLFRAALVEAGKQSDPSITCWKDIERQAKIKALTSELKSSRTEVKALTVLVGKEDRVVVPPELEFARTVVPDEIKTHLEVMESYIK